MEREKKEKEFKRWTVSRKKEVVLRLMRGESKDVISRELGLEIYLLEQWHSDALQGMELGLKARRDNPIQLELDKAKKRLGELLMENELLQEKANRAPAFHLGRLKK